MITRWMRVRTAYNRRPQQTEQLKKKMMKSSSFVSWDLMQHTLYIQCVCVCFDFVTFYCGDIESLSLSYECARARTNNNNNNEQAMWSLMCCVVPPANWIHSRQWSCSIWYKYAFTWQGSLTTAIISIQSHVSDDALTMFSISVYGNCECKCRPLSHICPFQSKLITALFTL